MKFLLRPIVLCIFLFLNYLPLILGVGYAAGMLIAGSAAVVASPPWAWTILRYGWKVYLALAAVTAFVMTTFSYQHCCVGLNSFPSHIRHFGKKHFENLKVAVLWPYGWYVVDRNMRGWGMDYVGILENVVLYWAYEMWKGVRMETWTVKDGQIKEQTATRIPSDGR